ncbi:RICIN domain-containing protein [Streptomyces tsukubensis]|uniref:RICIN domain-containing protein n=1 Tax=Streptomyces tsukubensis TaxID=83656 RepID=UPI00344DFAE3
MERKTGLRGTETGGQPRTAGRVSAVLLLAVGAFAAPGAVSAATPPEVPPRATAQHPPLRAAAPVRIRTFADKCFDVAGGTSGDDVPIVQYDCNNQANQTFTVEEVGNGEVRFRTFAGKCLDVRGESTGDNARIIQYRCTGLFNQRFRLSSLGGTSYQIRTFADKCLDVYGGSANNDVPIVQYRCSGQFNQRFTIG